MEEETLQLGPDSLQLLGQAVCDLILCLGNLEEPTSPQESVLFCEAIAKAITQLAHREQTQTILQAHAINKHPSMTPLSLADLAEASIDFDDFDELSEEEQLARSKFALALDPSCTDAYLIEGELLAKRHAYQTARQTYEQAMEIAAEQLGPEAFTEQGQAQGIWYELEARPYMRARTALAYLLWQNIGDLKGALIHFEALLTLNPNDNQGNRFAFLCCLLEAGQDAALATALERFRTTTDENGESYDVTNTIWHYTHACWLFRQHPPAEDTPLTSEATTALQQAFTYNQYVPALLLTHARLPNLEELGPYAKGDRMEATMYATMAAKGWQQTPGALPWLETIARHAGLETTTLTQRRRRKRT